MEFLEAQVCSSAAHFSAFGRPFMFGTAQVLLVSPAGEALSFRALIDPATEGSFISESAAQALSLRNKPQRLQISGVGADVKASQGSTAQVSSICDKASGVSVSAAVLPKLTSLLPKQPLIRCKWSHLNGLTLADPNYHQPAGID